MSPVAAACASLGALPPEDAWLAVVVPSAGAEEVLALEVLELPPPQPAASSPATTTMQIRAIECLAFTLPPSLKFTFSLRCTPLR